MPNCHWYKYRTRNEMEVAVIDASKSIREVKVYIKLVYGRSLTLLQTKLIIFGAFS